jgi:hypothetical protein
MQFLADEIMFMQIHIHIEYKLFPNISIMLEEIHIFKTSVTVKLLFLVSKS